MKWISVKDKLPEAGELVLTLCNGTHLEYRLEYRVDIYPDEIIWSHRLADDYAKVTHWMPLPELPEKE